METVLRRHWAGIASVICFLIMLAAWNLSVWTAAVMLWLSPLLLIIYLLLIWGRPSLKTERERAARMQEFEAWYPFLGKTANIFNHQIRVDYSAPNGEYNWALLRPLRRHDPDEALLAVYALERATLFEAHRRGLPITDDNNQLLDPELLPQGFIVEKRENDDGSVDAIVAYDMQDVCSRQDYDMACYQLRMIGNDDNWIGTILDPPELREEGIAPLLRPALQTVRLVEADPTVNPFRPKSTQKGSAQWAWTDEMRRADPVRFIDNHALQFGSRSNAPGALLGAFIEADWNGGVQGASGVVYARGEGHRIIVGPSGSGKFTSAFAPLLLTADNASAVVFDVANGEAARVTAPWRSTLGPVLVVDPFGVSGLESGSLNPFDLIRADDPDVLDAAKHLTDALFIAKPGTANDEYWNDQARDVLTALILHVATDPLGTDRTLRRLREIIRRPYSSRLLADMESNPVAGGIVRDMAANLIEASKAEADKNTYIVTTTLRANTAFLDLPAVQRATEKTSFDLRELRQRVSTLYICLPEKQLGAVGRWLRLVYANVMEQARMGAAIPLHVLIDEFPALGPFPRVKDDMALVRKHGIHIHIATQSLTQLEGIYGRDWQSFMSAAKYQQLLGANDQMTAEYFSKRFGQTTRRTTSTSQNRSSGGGSQSTSTSWDAADLISPDELGRLSPDTTVIAVEGMNPLILRKLRYHDTSPLMARTRR